MKIIHTRRIYSAFNLAELLTVTAMVAILGGLSLSAYNGYIMTSRVNGMWAAAQSVKVYAEAAYIKYNQSLTGWNAYSGTTDFTTNTAPYIKCVSMQNGIISVVGQPSYFGGSTVWVSWVPTISSSRLTWACTYSSTAANYITDSGAGCTVGTANYSADSACV